MERSEQSMVGLTEQILRIPYFWDDASAPLDEARIAIHGNLLQLVEQERASERESAWQKATTLVTPETHLDQATWDGAWQERWRFTFNRQAELIRKHPLAVRMAGRGVMQLNNAERLDDEGRPLNARIAATCNMVPLLEVILLRPEDPNDTTLQLARAGFFGGKQIRSQRNDLNSRISHEVPEDAIDYLEAYPPAPTPRNGEMNRAAMQEAFDASDNMLIGIINEHGLYPVVRRFQGRGGREVEFYTEPDVIVIEKAVESMPRKGDYETPLSELVSLFGTQLMLSHVLHASGVAAPYRRLPGQGRGMCVNIHDIPTLQQTYENLTTLQKGEKGYEEIAKELRVSLTAARAAANPRDIATSRPLWPKEGTILYPRRVFPEEVAERIKHRITRRRTATAPASRPRQQPSTTQTTPSQQTVHEPSKPTVSPTRVVYNRYQATPAGERPLGFPYPIHAPSQQPASAPSVERATATKAEPEQAPEELRRNEKIALARITSAMRVMPNQTIRQFLATQPRDNPVYPRTGSGLAKHIITGERAATIARNLLSERLRRLPSSPVNILQMALITNIHPADLVEYLRRHNHLAPEAKIENVTFNERTLKTILASLGVQLED